MKDKRCLVCKYQSIVNVETHLNMIYGPRDKNLTILLCYGHTVELFKMGQTNFMCKYKPNFSNFHGLEDDRKAINFFSSF